MKKLLFVLVVLAFVIGCGDKSAVIEYGEEPKQVVYENYTQSEMSAFEREEKKFGDMRERMTASRNTNVNGIECKALWLIDGDNLADLMWARYGKNKNIARIMEISRLNELTHPDEVYKAKPLLIPVMMEVDNEQVTN